MSFKKIASVIFLAGLLWPAVLLAAAIDAAPAANVLCWDKKDCLEARALMMAGSSQKDIEDGWVQETPCIGGSGGKQWGKCLAAGRTVTEISFGGQTTFAHMGEFIIVVYNYALRIASILAVVMIIVAGIQWVTSGGNSESITSAKKRIAGAMMGLFIAFLSYFILQAINPSLLSLRLPQVWMIKTIKLPPEFCIDKLEPGKGALPPHARVGEQGDTVKTDATTKYDKTMPEAFLCGSQFLPPDSAQVCYGHFCGDGTRQVCTKFGEDKKKPYVCRDGYLAGKIMGFGDTLKIKTVDGPIKLLALCADGSVKEADKIADALPDIDQSKKPPQYIFKGANRQALKDICDYFGPPKFFLAAEVNDEGGGTGKVKEGTVFSSGCDDWYAIGRAGKGSHECSVNLAKVANRLTNAFPGVDCKTKFDLGGCSCAFTAYTDMTGELYENKGSDGYFITAEELNRGFICDLNINRSEFPSLDNTNKWLCKAGIVAGAIVAGPAGAAYGCAWTSGVTCMVESTSCGGGTSLLPSAQKALEPVPMRNLR